MEHQYRFLSAVSWGRGVGSMDCKWAHVSEAERCGVALVCIWGQHIGDASWHACLRSSRCCQVRFVERRGMIPGSREAWPLSEPFCARLASEQSLGPSPLVSNTVFGMWGSWHLLLCYWPLTKTGIVVSPCRVADNGTNIVCLWNRGGSWQQTPPQNQYLQRLGGPHVEGCTNQVHGWNSVIKGMLDRHACPLIFGQRSDGKSFVLIFAWIFPPEQVSGRMWLGKRAIRNLCHVKKHLRGI